MLLPITWRNSILSNPGSHDKDTVKMFVRMLTVIRFELIICLTLSLETPLVLFKDLQKHFRKGSNRKKDQTVKNEPKGKSKKRSYNNLLILVVGQSSFHGPSCLELIRLISSRTILASRVRYAKNNCGG